MNLISTLVGISVAGASMPMMMQMSIAPFEAQKRTGNLGIAESSAVTYAALNEGSASLTAPPTGCEVTSSGSAHIITCTEGEGTRFIQSVTRAFRTNTGGTNANNDGSTGNSGNASSVRTFDFIMPTSYEPHQCPPDDPWGVQHTNARWFKQWGWGACTPAAIWNKENYLASNPDDWLYDLSKYGFGQHPDY